MFLPLVSLFGIRRLETTSRLSWPDHLLMNTKAYVAFLRGVNVGGNTVIKMSQLKEVFEKLGFSKVVPVLASGNVVFEAKAKAIDLKQRIDMAVEKKLGIRCTSIVRSASEIFSLIKSNPFRRKTDQIKVQITFLGESTTKLASFPARVPAEDFYIVQVSPSELFSAVDTSRDAGTPELMKLLEKQFGKNITTRTLNTVEKIGKLLNSN
ncbi:MAG TPA: DUF1697 domain-containing protein [Patescibacteria group bacterium]|nr:DUF1697 domain-containing protein [Patescibacteria group bacterium]